jgi:hypothetical protein
LRPVLVKEKVARATSERFARQLLFLHGFTLPIDDPLAILATRDAKFVGTCTYIAPEAFADHLPALCSEFPSAAVNLATDERKADVLEGLRRSLNPEAAMALVKLGEPVSVVWPNATIGEEKTLHLASQTRKFVLKFLTLTRQPGTLVTLRLEFWDIRVTDRKSAERLVELAREMGMEAHVGERLIGSYPCVAIRAFGAAAMSDTGLARLWAVIKRADVGTQRAAIIEICDILRAQTSDLKLLSILLLLTGTVEAREKAEEALEFICRLAAWESRAPEMCLTSFCRICAVFGEKIDPEGVLLHMNREAAADVCKRICEKSNERVREIAEALLNATGVKI